MREILFRGRRRDNREWVFGCYYKQSEFYGEKAEGIMIITSSESLCYDQALEYYAISEETVGQFTGLYDSTKWEDLTDAEKADFYHQHYIGQDGMSVRFQHIDDVKHLWEGKKIFEGDIVCYTVPDDSFAYGLVKFCEHGNGGICNVGFYIDWFRRHDSGWLRKDIGFWAKYREIKVIGNIHDNPELLETA